jgi:hypothetical protein
MGVGMFYLFQTLDFLFSKLAWGPGSEAPRKIDPTTTAYIFTTAKESSAPWLS